MRPLHGLFSAVPPSYDRMNRLLTLRLDESWRRRAAEVCLAGRPGHILDLCTGTADLALRLARADGGPATIAALDFSSPMLAAARRKAEKHGIRGLGLVEGDAAGLPFRDGRFDVVGIAFGFRNLTFRNPFKDRYLAEVLRVLRPGGRFVIVETSQPRSRILKGLVHAYLEVVAGRIGGLVSGHPGAYRYLARSAIHFYRPDELLAMLRGAGFSAARHTPLFGGVAGLTVAVKSRSGGTAISARFSGR